MSKQRAAPAWDSALREFWASHLEDLRVSLPRHRAVMTVRVIGRTGEGTTRSDRVIVSWHELAFEGMTRFTFADSDVDPWWTVELTAIGKREAEEGRTEYGFDLTALEDALVITCDEVRVTFLQQEEMPESAIR